MEAVRLADGLVKVLGAAKKDSVSGFLNQKKARLLLPCIASPTCAKIVYEDDVPQDVGVRPIVSPVLFGARSRRVGGRGEDLLGRSKIPEGGQGGQGIRMRSRECEEACDVGSA